MKKKNENKNAYFKKFHHSGALFSMASMGHHTGVLTAMIVKRDMKVANLIAWGRVKLRINITCVFRSWGNCPSRAATRAISATFQNKSDINP